MEPTLTSIVKEIIDLDGDKCQVTEIEPSIIYKTFLNYLCEFGNLESPSLKYLVPMLYEIEKVLIEK